MFFFSKAQNTSFIDVPLKSKLLVRLKTLLRKEKGILKSIFTVKNHIKQLNYSFKIIKLIPTVRRNEKAKTLRQQCYQTYRTRIV